MAIKLEDQLRAAESALEEAKKNYEVILAEDRAAVTAAEEALRIATADNDAAKAGRAAAYDAAAQALSILEPGSAWSSTHGRSNAPRDGVDFTDQWRAAVLAWAGLSAAEVDEASSRGSDLLLPAMRTLAVQTMDNVPAVGSAVAVAKEAYNRKTEAEKALFKVASRGRQASSLIGSRQSHVHDAQTKIAARDARKLDQRFDAGAGLVKPKKADPRLVEARRRLANANALGADKNTYPRPEYVPPFIWPPKETP